MPQVAQAAKAVPESAPFFPVDRAALDVEIAEGRLSITPAVARRILAQHNYERQRMIRQAHVDFLSDEMRRGSFLPGSQIAFARQGAKLILTNGQHRLAAQVQAAATVEYQVLIQNATTPADVHRLYYRQDRGGRARSDAEVLASVGVAERYGLSATLTRAVFQAQPLIANGFARPTFHQDPTLRNDDLRLEQCRVWWPLAATYQCLVEPAPAAVRKRLYSSQAVAVALVTMKHQPQRAAEFWAGIAKDDGLRRDDPRKAFLIDLGSREWGRKSSDGSAAAAAAWNAFFEERPLKLVKVIPDAPIRIAGTAVYGRKR